MFSVKDSVKDGVKIILSCIRTMSVASLFAVIPWQSLVRVRVGAVFVTDLQSDCFTVSPSTILAQPPLGLVWFMALASCVVSGLPLLHTGSTFSVDHQSPFRSISHAQNPPVASTSLKGPLPPVEHYVTCPCLPLHTRSLHFTQSLCCSRMILLAPCWTCWPHSSPWAFNAVASARIPFLVTVDTCPETSSLCFPTTIVLVLLLCFVSFCTEHTT